MFESDSSFFLDPKNIYKNTTVSLFTKIIAAKDLVCQKDDLYCNYCSYLSIYLYLAICMLVSIQLAQYPLADGHRDFQN